MSLTNNDTLDSSSAQTAALAENANLDFVPSVTRDLALLQVSPELKSAVLGLRRTLTLKTFLTMELADPLFAVGSVQATAREELMKLPGLNGTRAAASKALKAAIKHSKLYKRVGYWGAHRCYFTIFDIYKALLAAQHRNDLIVRDFKNPKRKNRRERNPDRLAEAKLARHSRWATEARAEAVLLRKKAAKLLAEADELEIKADADERMVAHLKNDLKESEALT